MASLSESLVELTSLRPAAASPPDAASHIVADGESHSSLDYAFEVQVAAYNVAALVVELFTEDISSRNERIAALNKQKALIQETQKNPRTDLIHNQLKQGNEVRFTYAGKTYALFSGPERQALLGASNQEATRTQIQTKLDRGEMVGFTQGGKELALYSGGEEKAWLGSMDGTESSDWISGKLQAGERVAFTHNGKEMMLFSGKDHDSSGNRVKFDGLEVHGASDDRTNHPKTRAFVKKDGQWQRIDDWVETNFALGGYGADSQSVDGFFKIRGDGGERNKAGLSGNEAYFLTSDASGNVRVVTQDDGLRNNLNNRGSGGTPRAWVKNSDGTYAKIDDNVDRDVNNFFAIHGNSSERNLTGLADHQRIYVTSDSSGNVRSLIHDRSLSNGDDRTETTGNNHPTTRAYIVNSDGTYTKVDNNVESNFATSSHSARSNSVDGFYELRGDSNDEQIAVGLESSEALYLTTDSEGNIRVIKASKDIEAASGAELGLQEQVDSISDDVSELESTNQIQIVRLNKVINDMNLLVSTIASMLQGVKDSQIGAANKI